MVAQDEPKGGGLVAVLDVAGGVDVVGQLQLLVVLEGRVCDQLLGDVAKRVDDALCQCHCVGVGGEQGGQVGGVAREHVLQALRVEHDEGNVDVVGQDAAALVNGVVDGQVKVLALDLLQDVAVTQETVAERERRLVECRHYLPQGGVEECLQ